MAHSVSTIKGPNGPLNIVFGEATPDQQVPICEVATAAFAPHLPASVFLEHGEALSHTQLAQNKGIRYWCISLADDPASVLTLCGTIRRPLLVRDSESTREEEGYCVFMVATHTQYRRLGLAKMLMNLVAEWLDGSAGVAASMLYTSVGDFYVSMGWEIIVSTVSTITHTSGSFPALEHTGLPSTRLLSDEEVPALCDRDVRDVKDTFEKATVGENEVHLAVLPNREMISYVFKWGDVLSLKLRGKTSQVHGAICEEADTWIYWHHGFDKLMISRVRTPPENKNSQDTAAALAGLLLHALDEARQWGFSKIVAWEPSPELLTAFELIKNKVNVDVITEQRQNSKTSVRWKGSDHTKKTILYLNENYAAS